MTIAELVRQSHALATEKGWWPWGVDINIPEKLALVHSEVSEALECYRRDEMESTVDVANGKPEGFAIELADAVIRIADLCGKLGIDLEQAISEKHAFNVTRPYRHGGKKA